MHPIHGNSKSERGSNFELQGGIYACGRNLPIRSKTRGLTWPACSFFEHNGFATAMRIIYLSKLLRFGNRNSIRRPKDLAAINTVELKYGISMGTVV